MAPAGRSAAETQAKEELHGGGVRGRGRRGGGQRGEKPEGGRDAGAASWSGPGRRVSWVRGRCRYPQCLGEAALQERIELCALWPPAPQRLRVSRLSCTGDSLRVRPSKRPLTRWRLAAAGPSGSSEPVSRSRLFLGRDTEVDLGRDFPPYPAQIIKCTVSSFFRCLPVHCVPPPPHTSHFIHIVICCLIVSLKPLLPRDIGRFRPWRLQK